MIYVDDILLIRTDAKFIDKLVSKLDTQFSLKRLVELSYFLGFEVEKIEKDLFFRQFKYAYKDE